MEIIDTKTLSTDVAAELDRIHADNKASRVAAIMSSVKCASCKAQGVPLVNFAQDSVRAVDTEPPMQRFRKRVQELESLRRPGTVALVDAVSREGYVVGRIAVGKPLTIAVLRACGHYVGWGLKR